MPLPIDGEETLGEKKRPDDAWRLVGAARPDSQRRIWRGCGRPGDAARGDE